MGLTLLEAAKSERDPARLAVIRELAEGELMRVIPFQDVEGEGVFYDVEQELPSVGFRGINETLDASYGVLNPQSERLKWTLTPASLTCAALMPWVIRCG
jgi:hypothetical protein